MAQHTRVFGHAAAIVPSLFEHDPGRDDASLPSALSPDRRSEPALSVERRHQVLQVDQLGFQLDEEERGSLGVPREDVDRSPLAVDRERRFDSEVPARHARETRDEGLLERGMALVEEPWEVGAAPSELEDESGVERRCRRAKPVDRQLGNAAVLDPGDRGMRAAGDGGDVRLTPAAPKPQGTQRCADLLVLHEPMVTASG